MAAAAVAAVVGACAAPKPRVVYLKSGETQVDPVAIGTPYLDIKLTGCRKVVDGGILTQDHDIYVQGSDVASPGEYHVRIGFDDCRGGDGQCTRSRSRRTSPASRASSSDAQRLHSRPAKVSRDTSAVSSFSVHAQFGGNVPINTEVAPE